MKNESLFDTNCMLSAIIYYSNFTDSYTFAEIILMCHIYDQRAKYEITNSYLKGIV